MEIKSCPPISVHLIVCIPWEYFYIKHSPLH
uniref:Uncharacterized protein n=1 Tax=Rhizophora mucronata TaxID=61149 RepID=A0A2P2MLH7_RHIMU